MLRKFDPETMYEPAGKYYGAVGVGPGERLIYSSGIVGATDDGSIVSQPEEKFIRLEATLLPSLRDAT